MSKKLLAAALAAAFLATGGVAMGGDYVVDGTTAAGHFADLPTGVTGLIAGSGDTDTSTLTITTGAPASTTLTTKLTAITAADYQDLTITSDIATPGNADGRYEINLTVAGTRGFDIGGTAAINDALSMSNLAISGDGTTANIITGTDGVTTFGGGAGVRALGNKEVSFENMSVSDTLVNITTGVAANAYGAVGVSMGNALDQNGSSATFTDFDLEDNTVTVLSSGGSGNAIGGGAAITNYETVTYAGGSVSGNSIRYESSDFNRQTPNDQGGFAGGAGLAVRATHNGSVPGTGLDREVTISDVIFDGNTAELAVSAGGARKIGDPSQDWIGGGALLVQNVVTGSMTFDLSENLYNENAVISGVSGTNAAGGAIYASGNVEGAVTDSDFTGNTITHNGAALGTALGGAIAMNSDATTHDTVLTLSGNTFTENTVEYALGSALGGAVFTNRATEITGDTYSKNEVTGHDQAWGGAVAFNANLNPAVNTNYADDTLTITGSSFSENKANIAANGLSGQGGAVWSNAVATTITGDTDGNALFSKNEVAGTAAGATGQGGALFVLGDNVQGTTSLTLDKVDFNENKVTVDGDAMGGAVYGGIIGTLTTTDLTFDKNEATSISDEASGGAMHFDGANLTLDKVSVTNNKATGDISASGGGIFIDTGSAVLSNGAMSGNEATSGSGIATGGALHVDTGTVELNKVNVTGNKATGDAFAFGGGVYVDTGSAEISDSLISGNHADGDVAAGGGIYIDEGTLDLTNVDLMNNTVTGDTAAAGGAVYVGGEGSVNVTVDAGKNVMVAGNTANGEASSFHIEADGTTLLGDAGAFNIAVGNGGAYSLLDPVTVNVTNGVGYDFNKTGTGTFNWDGANVFASDNAAADIGINITDGILNTGDTFTVAAGSATTVMDVNLDVDSVTVDLDRDQDLALFDFTNANAASTMTIADGTKLTADLASTKSVISYEDEYLIIENLDEVNQTGQFIADSSSDYLLTSVYRDGDNVYLGTQFQSPFDDNGVNALSVQNPLQSVLDNNPISNDEYYALLNSPTAAYSELYAEQGRVMVDAVDSTARSAVDMGLRQPHRASIGKDWDPCAPVDVCGEFRGTRVWAGYIGEWGKKKSFDGFNGYRTHRNGFLAGVNYDFGSAASLGIYGGYSHAKTKARNGVSSRVSSDIGHFGLIGRVSPIASARDFSIYADIGYHFSDNKMKRGYAGAGTWYNADGSFDQKVFTVGLGFEHVFRLGGVNVIPQAEARFTHLRQDGMTESGNSITVADIEKFNKSTFNTRLGVEVSKDFAICNGVITPSLNVAWKHNYGSRNYSSSATYLLDPSSIRYGLTSSPFDRDSVDIGVAVRAMKEMGSKRVGFNVGYNVNLSRRANSHSLYAGFDLGF